MPEREVGPDLIRRIRAASYSAGVRREAVLFDWPECHKPKCSRDHGSVDSAMGHMQHAIVESIVGELRWELTTRPDVGEDGDSPETVAVYTLSELLRRYNVRDTSTFVNAAHLIVEAYPEIVPALARKA